MIQNTQKGFTLFIAITVVGLLLVISIAITNIAYRETILSSTGRESQKAFFASNTGIECALYWDQKKQKFPNPGNPIERFIGDLNCVGVDFKAISETVRDVENTTFIYSFDELNISSGGDEYCLRVVLEKKRSNDPDASGATTTIQSRGYNMGCNVTNPKKLERALEVNYWTADPLPPATPAVGE